MWKKDRILESETRRTRSVQGSDNNQERWVGTKREKGKTNKTGESNGKEMNGCCGEEMRAGKREWQMGKKLAVSPGED